MRSLRLAGLLPAAEQAVQAWRAVANRKGDGESELRCVNALIRLALDRDEPETALRVGEQGLPLALGARRGSGEARCLLYVRVGLAAWRLGFFLKSMHFLDAAEVTTAEEPVTPGVRSRCLLLRGNLATEENRLGEAMACLTEARTLAREAGDNALVHRSTVRLAKAHNRAGELDLALEDLSGIDRTAPWTVLARGDVEYGLSALLRNRLDEAESWARVAASEYCRAPVSMRSIDLADLFALTGQVYLRRGGHRVAALLLSEAAKWYAMRHREQQFVSMQEMLARCAVEPRRGTAPDGTLMYLGDLVDNVVLHPDGTAPAAVHSRRVAHLIEQVGADLAPAADLPATEHAALLHELPCEQRWFCRLAEQGQAAERVLGAPQSEEGILLRLLDQYETLVAGGLVWSQALRRLRNAEVPGAWVDNLEAMHEVALDGNPA